MLIFEPGIWHYLENIIGILGLIVQSVLVMKKRISSRQSVKWFVGWLIFPIVTLGAYIMIGRAVFPREIPQWEIGKPGKNLVEYFSNGEQYFKSVFKDLENAISSICIECYLIRLDLLSERFVQILCRKSQEGIAVNIIFDDYGYDGKDFRIVKTLKKAGVKCAIFHNMTKCMLTPNKNYRNHRKTIAIDGHICYMGGYNIGEEYVHRGKFGLWEDSAVRIDGPQTQDVLKAFRDIWEYASKKQLSPIQAVYNEVCPEGTEKVSIINGNTIWHGENSIKKSIVQMIEKAEQSILIETPYFVPDRDLIDLLSRKLEGGTKVRILIPEVQDHVGCYWGNRFYAAQLIRKGAEVYCMREGFLHSKVIMCDDHLCSVGTANFDRRSLETNFECNIVIDSENVAKQIDANAMRIIQKSDRYTAEKFDSRTRSERIRTKLSVILSGQL